MKIIKINYELLYGLLILASMVMFVLAILLAVYYHEKYVTCPYISSTTGLKTKYRFLTGDCFVNYKGKWTPTLLNLRDGRIIIQSKN